MNITDQSPYRSIERPQTQVMIWNAYQAINNYDWRTSTTSMQIRAQIGPVQGPLGKRGTCGTKAGVSKDVGSAGGSLMIPADVPDGGSGVHARIERPAAAGSAFNEEDSPLSIAREVRPGVNKRLPYIQPPRGIAQCVVWVLNPS